jgi:hypothetical protein
VTTLVNRYTKAPIRFVAGLSLVVRAFEHPSLKLEATLLESLSRLFAQNVRVYAYPMTVVDFQEALKEFPGTRVEWSETNGWVSAEQMRLAPPQGHFYAYLLASHFIVPMQIPTAFTAEARA